MTTPLAKPQVLVVDDEWCVRDTLELLLRPAARVVATGSAEAALELLDGEDGTVDLAVVDLHFPPGSLQGPELIAILRERYPALPIMVLTADDGTAAAFRCGRLGAEQFLEKLPDLAVAAATIADAVRRLAGERERARAARPRRRRVARAAALPLPARPEGRVTQDSVLRALYRSALREHRGNMAAAARSVGVPYDTFRRRVIGYRLVGRARRSRRRRGGRP